MASALRGIGYGLTFAVNTEPLHGRLAFPLHEISEVEPVVVTPEMAVHRAAGVR